MFPVTTEHVTTPDPARRHDKGVRRVFQKTGLVTEDVRLC